MKDWRNRRGNCTTCLASKLPVAGAASARWLEVANSRHSLRSEEPLNDDAMLKLHRVSFLVDCLDLCVWTICGEREEEDRANV